MKNLLIKRHQKNRLWQAVQHPIKSQIHTQNKDFLANQVAMKSLVSEFHTHCLKVQKGGGGEALKRHKAKGKLTARERVQYLIDKDTQFLEFSCFSCT